MKKINRDQVLMLHSMVIKQSGGIDGVRDNGLLDSALHAPFQSFDNEELYPAKGLLFDKIGDLLNFYITLRGSIDERILKVKQVLHKFTKWSSLGDIFLS